MTIAGGCDYCLLLLSPSCVGTAVGDGAGVEVGIVVNVGSLAQAATISIAPTIITNIASIRIIAIL